MKKIYHEPHSVEVIRNSKGEYSWKIKRYFGDDKEKCLEEINYIDIDLRFKYCKSDNDIKN